MDLFTIAFYIIAVLLAITGLVKNKSKTFDAMKQANGYSALLM